MQPLPPLTMASQLAAKRMTDGGDSVSLDVAMRGVQGISLVGMHIAGNLKFGSSYLLASWRLLSASFNFAMQARIPGPDFSGFGPGCCGACSLRLQFSQAVDAQATAVVLRQLVL